MKSSVLFLSAALSVAAVQTFAATEVADADGNGFYSMEELTVAYPDLTEEAFAGIDTDASGEISEDELMTAMENGVLPE